MVSFYKPARKTAAASTKAITPVTVDVLDMNGVGVCRGHKPILFVEGALPGEQVKAKITSSQKQMARASVKQVTQGSPYRRQPFCPVYQQCGGCQLQHADPDYALQERQQAMADYWRHQLKLTDLPWQPPLTGPRPAYRRKARLAIDGRQPGQVRLGYRQQGSKNIVDIPQCPVLVSELQQLIKPLKTLLNAFANSRHLGHLHLLAGDNVVEVSINTSRDLSDAMLSAWQDFGVEHGCNVVLEDSHGQQRLLHHHATLRCYTEDDLYLTPAPQDFVQVNRQVNQAMIAQAMHWLDPQPHDVIADWFAGLGNFSLSLARRCAQVQAVEGVAAMVHKGQANAQEQGIASIDWCQLDLNDAAAVQGALAVNFDKMVLDPSREGASTVCQALAGAPVEQVLYVSCNPSSFTRDAGYLLEAGYTVEKIGLIEMFPYTRHLEVMALFTFQARPTKKAS